MRFLSFPAASFAFALLVAACTGAHPAVVTHVTPVRRMPLTEAMVLLIPAERNDILGLVFDVDPGDARAVADLGGKLRDNPCGEFLERDDQVLTTRVADAWPMSDPVVPLLGFDAYRGTSTHLFVMLESPAVSRVEPGEGYRECCEAAECGAGMVSAVYEGRLNLHPAMNLPMAAPPIVLIGQSGDSLGLGLHDGKTFEGVVAVELMSR